MKLFEVEIPDEVWMPIVVALVTTLIISPLVGLYIKPRIEARQQRLIRDRQQIDEVIFKFQKLSLSIATLIPKVPKNNELLAGHNAIMLQQAQVSAYELNDALSRLSPLYVQKHRQHIGDTMLFIGYLLGQITAARTQNLTPKLIDDLKIAANNLESFDVYFRANVSLADSQEKWYRRLYWYLFNRNNTKLVANQVLKNYKLK